jgi:CheY-like chemotaxis protein
MLEKSSPTILLVDDDPLILELGRELLTRLEYRVETAIDGTQALGAFRRQGADLVLLDYQLPGMDGYQLFQELQALDAGVKVLVASGFLSEGEATRLQKGGVRGIIYKPFRLTELQRQIQAALVS